MPTIITLAKRYANRQLAMNKNCIVHWTMVEVLLSLKGP